MIWNAGELPQNSTIDRLTSKHASSPYNPDIANAFFRVAFLESWGRGIDLIRNACRAHGSPAPEFRWDNGLWVKFPFGTPASDLVKLESRLGSPLAGRIVAILSRHGTG